MKSLTEKYNAVLEGKFTKFQFLRDVRMSHPNLITQFNGFEDTVQILKNKGMISEIYPGPVVTMNTIPLEALERGVDVELEEMGLDSVQVPSEEDHKKATDKAVKNLEKNVLHYLEKLADVKPSAKRTDVMKDATPANVVDTDNGMVKVTVNEMAVAKDLIKTLIQKALNEAEEEDTFQEEPPQADAQSNRERQIKARNVLNTVLPLIDANVDLQDVADPRVLDMFLEELKDEILSKTEIEDLTQPNLQEVNPRRKFTYEGKIV
jgi:hypothetical protein